MFPADDRKKTIGFWDWAFRGFPSSSNVEDNPGLNPVQKFFNVKNDPRNPGRNVTGGQPTRPPIPGYNFTPYAIQTGDTFEKIAESNGLTVQQLQQANNGMIVPPPKGSRINLPYKSSVPVLPGVNPQLFASQSRGPGANSFTSGSNVNLAELQANITSKLQNGQLPGSIPFQVSKRLINPVTGKPFTDNDYKAEGYLYNNRTQTWEQPGVGANTPSVQTNASSGKPWEQIVNYNGKQVPAYVAELMYKRQNGLDNLTTWQKVKAEQRERNREREALRKARAKKPVAVETPAEATNAGGTPATTLDVAIGGGD